MDSLFNLDMIRPLLISENRTVSEVRRHSRKLAADLTERITPEIANDRKVLFVFVMRGAMLLYLPFAEKFDSASFTFASGGSYTGLDCKDYDTVIIVDTVVETGKTIMDVKKLLLDSGISAKRWFCGCVFAKSSVKAKITEYIDRFFCLAAPEEIKKYIDAGKYATCGDRAQITVE